MNEILQTMKKDLEAKAQAADTTNILGVLDALVVVNELLAFYP